MSCTSIESLSWMVTDPGVRLLTEVGEMPRDRLTRITRLRKLVSQDLATAVVEQLELRERAVAKFTSARTMLFTAQGLEQATGERIARYRASQFPRDIAVLDACSGIGADARWLSAEARVLAVDKDPSSAYCCAHNIALAYHCEAGASRDSARTVCADVTSLDLATLARQGFEAAYFDPSRRGRSAGGSSTRIRNSDDYSPPLPFLDRLLEQFPFVCAKVSPAVDDETLQRYVEQFACTAEFIAERGECKEAVIWSAASSDRDSDGNIGDAAYRATVLDSDNVAHTLRYDDVESPYGAAGAASEWLYEPQPCVVRAHLVPVLAAQLSAEMLSLGSWYLTSSHRLDTPFATRYRVLDSLPLRPDDVQKRCVELGIRVTAVKTRWDAAEPEAFVKKIPGVDKRAGGRAGVVIVVTSEEKKMALICETP